MKRIHFDNQGKISYLIVVIILSLIFIVIGEIKPFGFENQRIYSRISSCGFFLQVIYCIRLGWSDFFIRFFWFKNAVQWNAKRIVIRINSSLEKTLSFADIKRSEFDGKTLILSKVDGEKVVFDLNGYMHSDSHKLNEIIIKYTNTKR